MVNRFTIHICTHTDVIKKTRLSKDSDPASFNNYKILSFILGMQLQESFETICMSIYQQHSIIEIDCSITLFDCRPKLHLEQTITYTTSFNNTLPQIVCNLKRQFTLALSSPQNYYRLPIQDLTW